MCKETLFAYSFEKKRGIYYAEHVFHLIGSDADREKHSSHIIIDIVEKKGIFKLFHCFTKSRQSLRLTRRKISLIHALYMLLLYM